MTRVGFHPAARLELHEAASYYEANVAGLGEEFIAEVEQVCALLGEHPSLGARYDIRHRRALIRRFPFALIYRVHDSALTIVAVAHTKRWPGYWRGRDTGDRDGV